MYEHLWNIAPLRGLTGPGDGFISKVDMDSLDLIRLLNSAPINL